MNNFARMQDDYNARIDAAYEREQDERLQREALLEKHGREILDDPELLDEALGEDDEGRAALNKLLIELERPVALMDTVALLRIGRQIRAVLIESADRYAPKRAEIVMKQNLGEL